MSSIGEGLFLQLSDREAAELWNAVESAGLPKDKAGAKTLLFALISAKQSAGVGGEKDILAGLEKYIRANPETVNTVIGVGGDLFKAGIGFLKKKKPAG